MLQTHVSRVSFLRIFRTIEELPSVVIFIMGHQKNGRAIFHDLAECYHPAIRRLIEGPVISHEL